MRSWRFTVITRSQGVYFLTLSSVSEDAGFGGFRWSLTPLVGGRLCSLSTPAFERPPCVLRRKRLRPHFFVNKQVTRSITIFTQKPREGHQRSRAPPVKGPTRATKHWSKGGAPLVLHTPQTPHIRTHAVYSLHTPHRLYTRAHRVAADPNAASPPSYSPFPCTPRQRTGYSLPPKWWHHLIMIILHRAHC